MTARLLVIGLVAVIVAACGGSGDAELVGPARTGAELFEDQVLAGNPGCITCHSLSPGVELVGPSLAGVATRAADRVPGVAPGDYLRASITEPGSYLVEGYDDRMPGDWAETLSSADIDALVAYLLTLEG